LPPATEPVITAQTVPALPAALLRSNVTIPAPAAQRPAEPSAAPVLPSGGRIQQALLVSRVMPAYPDLARRSGVFGIVRLEAVVDERGAVRDVKVVSGPPVLAVAAKDAVLKWKYTPGTLNDHPIATNVVIQINFGAQSK
jgi:TonB family protein